MSGRNEENLKELFERFVNSEQAEEAAEDIREGERIFRENPVPGPDEKAIADIKAEIATGLAGREANAYKRMVYKTAAVAAVFIILGVIGVSLFERPSGKTERVIYASIKSEAIWESDNVSADDADLATLVAEIEQAEREVLAVQLGENGGNGYGDLSELEIELIEINSDFWKG